VNTHTQSLNSNIQYFLSRFVQGKTVLDVGCVDHSASVERADHWLHKHLARSAGSILGLDILESDVDELRGRGYEMECGDAATVSLNRRFDVVVAGEIIEHVDDPAALVRNMARHLNDDGHLVVTTPHVFFFLHFLESIFSDGERRWNQEHVAWYCPFVLHNLLRRNNFEIESCYYFTRSRKLNRLMELAHLPCFGVIASSILVIARKKS
jgi:2-polyprenyl-3-methyl-5-hydroxy-6-metoxy-1,4-benzoquinol methylase